MAWLFPAPFPELTGGATAGEQGQAPPAAQPTRQIPQVPVHCSPGSESTVTPPAADRMCWPLPLKDSERGNLRAASSTDRKKELAYPGHAHVVQGFENAGLRGTWASVQVDTEGAPGFQILPEK